MEPLPSGSMTFEPLKVSDRPDVGAEDKDYALDFANPYERLKAVREEQPPTESPKERLKRVRTESTPEPAKPAEKPTKERKKSSIDLLRENLHTTAKERNDILDRRESAIAMGLEAERELADNTVKIREAQAQERAKLEEQRIANEKRRMDEETRRMSLIEEEINKPVDEKIDTNRLMKSRSTGQMGLGILGMLLSGMGSGMTGQRNMAYDVINKSVDDDVAAQKEKLANDRNARQQKLASRFTLLGQYRTKFQDERTAELMARDTLLQRHQEQLQLLSDKNKSSVVGAKAAEASAQIQEERNKIQEEVRAGTIKLTQGDEQRAAQAASARAKAAQEEAWRKAGVVKGPDGKFYQVSANGELVPLSEAASHNLGVAKLAVDAEKAKADAAKGGPQNSTAALDLKATYLALDGLKTQLGKDAAGGGKPWTPEGQNLGGKLVRKGLDTLGGAGTYKGIMNDAEVARATRFNNTRQALLSMGTQLTGAGAPSEGEALRSAAGSAQTEEELITLIDQYKPLLAQKLKAYNVDIGPAPVQGAVGAGQ